PDAERLERDHERVGAVRHPDARPALEAGGDLGLERAHVGPQDEAPGVEHAGDRPVDLVAQGPALGLDVHQGDAHGTSSPRCPPATGAAVYQRPHGDPSGLSPGGTSDPLPPVKRVLLALSAAALAAAPAAASAAPEVIVPGVSYERIVRPG